MECAAEVARWVAASCEPFREVATRRRECEKNHTSLCERSPFSVEVRTRCRPRGRHDCDPPNAAQAEPVVARPESMASLQQRHARLVGMTCALHHSTVDDSSASTECVERKPLSSPAVAEAAAEKKHDQDDDENPSPDRHRPFLLSSARVARTAAHLEANIRLVTRNAYRGHGEHPATPMRVKPRSCETSS